jgi:ubiquinone/menaquinone biosynthesis C-methylase UbiE
VNHPEAGHKLEGTVQRLDYNDGLYQRYDEGRRYDPETARQWAEIIGRYLPEGEELTVLDLGCGTGRFSRLLAERLGCRVVGVEPAGKMREVAERSTAHPLIRYLPGRGEDIPLKESACDAALLSMVVHHLEAPEMCWGELARVVRSGGRVLIRNCFSGRLDDIPLLRFFPGARAVNDARLPRIEAVEEGLRRYGLRKVARETVRQQTDRSLREHCERLRKGADSTLELLSDEQIRRGFEAMRRAVERDAEPGPVTEEIDLLVFEKPTQGQKPAAADQSS